MRDRVKDQDAGTAFRDGDARGHSLTIDFRPIPPNVAAHMRTLECPPASEAVAPVNVAAFARRATEIIKEIEEAHCDDLGLEDGTTALGVGEGRNTVTGAHGLILRRLMRRGRYSRPLGEIFSPTGLLDDLGKNNFDTFREFTYRHGLELWIHEVQSRERRGYIAFAIFRETEKSTRFCYCARLLVTPFEVAQWRNGFLEAGCARPS